MQDRARFLVAQPLEQHRFVRFDVSEKRRAARGRNGRRDMALAVARP
jgi:hypothetical protein